MQSLGLDVKVFDKYEEEIDLKQTFEEDDDIGLGTPAVPENFEFEESYVAEDLDDAGFGLEDENGDAIADSMDESDEI